MTEEMQKTKGCLLRDRTESEEYTGVQTVIDISHESLVEVNLSSEMLLETIVSRVNMNAAYKRVISNKGSGGVDNMGLEELLPYLKSHGEYLRASILSGRYKPNPVRRVEIPKDNGKTCQLGIPTLVDRVIQQSLSQVLSLIYEPQFSSNSYGFRPNRSAHDALFRSKELVNQGYRYCVDLDLENFFDTVNHSFLLRLLSFTIKDGRVISLIHKYLKAGVMFNGVLQDSPIGMPQGGPLSPLLSNIILNELDKELEKRGHPFVRYADDCVIFCKTPRAAERVKDSITNFIEKRLHLNVNHEKTVACSVMNIKFLGHSFYASHGSV